MRRFVNSFVGKCNFTSTEYGKVHTILPEDSITADYFNLKNTSVSSSQLFFIRVQNANHAVTE
jgi:hypothetical protein